MTQPRIEDLIELLELQPQVETGSDGFVFGNYVEFPPISRIDPDLIPIVLDMLGIPLPFAGSGTASSLRWLQNLDVSTRDLVMAALGDPLATATSGGDFLLTFPSLDPSSERTLKLLDHLFPSVLYEHDLPTDRRYWRPEPEDSDAETDDELLELYRSRPVTLDALVGEIEALRKKFDATQDATVQKALLLASFSLVESFTRQRALTNAPRFPDSPLVEKLILGILRREVQDDRRRGRVVNALEPEKAWDEKIPEWHLRNALAHDFGAVIAEDGVISFEDASRIVQARASDEVFSVLIGYAKKNLT